MKMKTVINALLGMSVVISLTIIAALIFATPVWLIWNLVVVDVFNAPHLSFFDTLWIMLMIRFIIPSETKTKDSK